MLDWLKSKVGIESEASRRRRRREREREEERSQREAERWDRLHEVVIAGLESEPTPDAPAEPAPADVSAAALMTSQLGSLEGGAVTIAVEYDDADGRIQKVMYKNETPYACDLTISLPAGVSRRFDFPANTPYREVNVPANARPNVKLDDLSISMGFSARDKDKK